MVLQATPDFRTHHLYLIPFESPLWQERIAFRDTLHCQPQVAADYARLKFQLATEYWQDRELYTANKWPFIKAVLAAVND